LILQKIIIKLFLL